MGRFVKGDVVVDRTWHSRLQRGGLKHPGNIRPNRLFTADGRIINYRAGAIKHEKLEEVIQKIIEIITG